MSDKVIVLAGVNHEIKARMIRGFISEAKGNIFSCYFKKLDGTMREMVCRRHVTKGVKGTSPYDVEKVDRSHNQLTVFDMQCTGFRKINLEEVLELKTDGVKYIFTDYPNAPSQNTLLDVLEAIGGTVNQASKTSTGNNITININLGKNP